MTTKTKTKTINSSIQSDRDNIKAKIQFKKEFVKQNFEPKMYSFTEKDLPLIEYLSSEEVNSNNRGKTDDNIRRLYRCLEADQWYATANVLEISREGVLLNGQHTFDAMNQWFRTSKKSKGKKVPVVFFIGVDPNSMPYIDTAKRRSPHQNLKIKHNGTRISLSPIQKEIVLTEGRYAIHGSPFAKSGHVNFFEYDNVIKKHSSMLDKIFGDRAFCSGFPKKAIGYALFCLAKENEELAESIMDEICKVHNTTGRKKSRFCKLPEEHSLVELFREEKLLKMSLLNDNGVCNHRDGYRQEEFYPLLVNKIVETYKVKKSIFPL